MVVSPTASGARRRGHACSLGENIIQQVSSDATKQQRHKINPKKGRLPIQSTLHLCR